MIESLESRRLWSAALVSVAAPAAHRELPSVRVVRPADDDSGDDDSGGDSSSNDDSSSSDDGSGYGDDSSGGDYADGSDPDVGGPSTAPTPEPTPDPTTQPTTSPVDTGGGGTDTGTGTGNGGTDGGGVSSTVDGSGDGELVPGTELPVVYVGGYGYDDYGVYCGGYGYYYPVRHAGADLHGTVRAKLGATVAAGATGTAVVRVYDARQPTGARIDVALGLARTNADGPDEATVAPAGLARGLVVHLHPGESAAYSVRYRVPADLPPGQYTLVAAIDSDDVVRESNEANNLAVGSGVTVVAAAPDVAASNATARLSAAGRGTVRVTATNAGNVPVAGTVTVTVTATPLDAAGNPAGAAVTVATVRRPLRLNTPGRAATLAVPVRLTAGLHGPVRLTVTLAPVTLPDSNPADDAAATTVVR